MKGSNASRLERSPRAGLLGLPSSSRSNEDAYRANNIGVAYLEQYDTDPDRAVASANLGAFYARRGSLQQSLGLWRTAFDDNPQLSELGVNLGNALCALGDANGARAVLHRVLKHNPDMGLARSALAIAVRGC